MDEKGKFRYDPLELARTIGEPVDPRRPFPTIVTEVAEIEGASPDEFVFFFDVLTETEKVINISANGEIVQENVTPDTPAQISFTDLATPEFFIKITDLASAKERVIARKVKTINRALNSFEEFKVMQLLDAAATTAGNLETLSSGQTKYRFNNLIDQIDQVQDFGENFVLIEGTQIAKDIRLWDFDDNKFNSPLEAMRALGVKEIRMPSVMQFLFADDGSAGGLTATDVLASDRAYLVATSVENGKPLLFVRKSLNEIEMLGGAINTQSGERPQRLVFVSPNPVTVTGTARFLAVAITGYEQIAVVVTNPNAVSRFERV